MDALRSHLAAATMFCFLFLVLLHAPTEAQICSAQQDVYVEENIEPGHVVETITVENGVTLAFKPEIVKIPFTLNGNQLVTTEVLDYESTLRYQITIVCSQEPSGIKFNLIIFVFVINMNDNAPVFSQSIYRMDVSEMTPVDTFVGSFPATDLDNPNQLYYRLESDSDFKLRAVNVPDILVNALLEYDKVKNVQLVLYVQDTPLTSLKADASHSATTTIMVTITDRDDRPPWFQPCDPQEVAGTLICQSLGYTGRVVQLVQETGALQLKPGPLHAVDGDSGINVGITYTLLSGNKEVFEVDYNTGDITMRKPIETLDTIVLTVMAAQSVNSYQFATTTVTISVVKKSDHPPKFQKSSYDAIVSSVGTMAMDANSKDQPLRIVATDDDYASLEGLNPYISYSINGNSAFTILNGFLFMTRDLPEGPVSLQVVATDTSTEETATAGLSVTVTLGLTTTTQSTDITSETTVGESTAVSSVSTNPSLTSEGSSTVRPPAVVTPSGGFGVTDMAALGATLGVLLFLCLVVIGLLIYRMRKGKADWKKIHEANVFRSSLGKGSSGPKEGIQYSNEAFEKDDDGGSVGSSGPAEGSVVDNEEPQKKERDLPLKEAQGRSSRRDSLSDDSSLDSDKADSEKGVKPILTKERRMEEGYKAVWFKEDIDPNAKEEVVIIPDRREDDSQDEEEDEEEEERGADLDSGLGVKMEDFSHNSDSDNL